VDRTGLNGVHSKVEQLLFQGTLLGYQLHCEPQRGRAAREREKERKREKDEKIKYERKKETRDWGCVVLGGVH
jgi:hypothetical protein